MKPFKVELGHNVSLLILLLAIIAALCYGCNQLVQYDIAMMKAKAALTPNNSP